MDRSDLDFVLVFFFYSIKKAKLTFGFEPHCDCFISIQFPLCILNKNDTKELRMGRETSSLFFLSCLKLVPQDGNLATDMETQQVCLQSFLLPSIMKPTRKLK